MIARTVVTYQLWGEQSDEQPSDLSSDLMAAKDVYKPMSHAVGCSLFEPCGPWQALIRAHTRQVKVNNLPCTQGKRHEA